MRNRMGSWRLFWALALAISVVNGIGLAGDDFRSARGTVPAILLAVRCALPLFILAFVASSAAALWPGERTRWLLSNRRYLGLSFAFGMAWHFAFVGYYLAEFGNHLNRTVITVDLIGLSFLLALTLTSFRRVAQHLSTRSWRCLHKTGVYAIWLLATYTYAEAVRWGPDAINTTALVILLAAWVLRLIAGVHQRHLRRTDLRPLSRRSAPT